MRSIALLSYRNYEAYGLSQPRHTGEETSQLRVKSYQRYQGDKLANRFNALSYYRLSQAMDSHDIGKNRGSLENALSQIRAKSLILSMENDVLFPKTEQEFLARYIERAMFFEIPTRFGHDGFLLEAEHIQTKIREFLKIERIKIKGLNNIRS